MISHAPSHAHQTKDVQYLWIEIIVDHFGLTKFYPAGSVSSVHVHMDRFLRTRPCPNKSVQENESSTLVASPV